MIDLLYLILFLIAIHTTMVWIAAIRFGLRQRHHQRAEAQFLSTEVPFISVIIPAWRERGTIEKCIETLQLVDYPDWEVIIVAGGPDNTYGAALKAGKGISNCLVIEQQPRGKNAAINQGFRNSRGDMIVVLDADSQVSPGWLSALAASINKKSPVAIGKPVALRHTPISISEEMEQIDSWEIHHRIILQGSGSIAIQRDVVAQMDGFPEEVTVGVDWDLSARLTALGIPFTYCPQAIVHTERPATILEYWQNEVRWRRAHLLSLFRLHSFFLGSLKSILTNLYFYFLSWFTVLFSLTAGFLLVTGWDRSMSPLIVLWLIFLAWVLFRRACIAGEIAAYTGNMDWLKWSWVPPFLLMISFLATVIATLTLKQNGFQFKGPRLSRELKDAR